MSGFSWFHLAIAAGVVLLLVGVIVLFARAGLRRGRAAGSDSSSPVVSVTLSLAAIWAGFAVIGAAIAVLTTLLQPQVQITVPVQEFWPALPEGTVVEGTPATRVGGGFTSAGLLVDGLSTGARVCWAISQALGWLVPGAIAGLIAVACFQLLAGRAFAPVVARMAMVTAVVVMVGGIAAQVLGDIAGSMAAAEVLQWTSAEYEEVAGIEDVLQAWWPQPGFGITFPFWPIAAGLAFAALAAVFRYGSALQRDTEGLV
ncbi:hypothetical protein [Microbacterium terricola]|uniref:Uncharacterized protein n=1 Tax=Microbacterium terricola TaxID=344163 RepID=A0ABM8DVM4_9MICO|nr:hypothetical protein [Microbacterium terricola]UYK39696.1 hypothetical protein OAU46_13490 [Microbacterium terricola]BDV29560.1 hypothetical protein Microterr_02200 [Microbacterium terricola]